MKVVIGEPNWLVRLGLERAISSLGALADTIAVATIDELHRVLREHRDTDFVLVDDVTLGFSEEDHFARIRKLAPDAAVAVLVGDTDRERVLKAVYYGAVAIVEKNANEDVVAGALRLFFAGQVALPRDLLAEGPPPAATVPAANEGPIEDDPLTPREREVIGHVGAGKTVARIAAELKLSPHTVRVHVTRIMKKLEIRDRSSLIHYAVKRSEEDAHRNTPDRFS